MLTLDELIREGEAIRAEELAEGHKDFRSRIQRLGLPVPVASPAFAQQPGLKKDAAE
jgi:hypothetical protein